MRRALVPALVAVALLAAGCGGSGNKDQGQTPGGGKGRTSTNGGGGNKGTETASSGKQLFTNTCGSRHTLKNAGTTGSVGPHPGQPQPAQATGRHHIQH